MGNNETMTSSKTEKMPSPVQLQEQPAFHPFPDWAAMQAYYGPGVMLPPYFGMSIVPGFVPHPYMWAPRPFIPPFASPYAGMHPNGAYSHSTMPPGSHAPNPAATEAAVMATPLSVEAPDTSLGGKDKGLTTKLNVAVGNIASNTAASDRQHELSQSGYNSAEGSSDGSNSAGGSSNQRNVCSEDRPSSDDRRIDMDSDPVNDGERSTSMKFSSGVSGTSGLAQAFSVKKNGSPVLQKTIPMMPGSNGLPSEPWKQGEWALKLEKRKQSNRESARRSRLRKQAENEELAKQVDNLAAENTNLRSEISQLTADSNALRTENSTLLERLKNSQLIQAEESSLPEEEIGTAQSIVAANFLSMIDKPSSISPTVKLEHENCGMPSSKLKQFLGTSPSSDAVQTVLGMVPETIQDKVP